MKLIHCSFDLVDDFAPRIPDSRVKHDGKDYEDAVTPRICTAPTILQCLKSIPKAGETIRWMRAVGLPPVIHAYYLTSGKVHQATTSEVIDADITQETWILDRPDSCRRRDYLITSCFMTDQKDLFGRDVVAIHGVEIERCKNTDSLRDLVEGLGLEYDDFMRRFPFLTFRALAVNVSCTDELRERREKHLKHLKHKKFETLQKRVKAYRDAHPDINVGNIRQGQKCPELKL